MFFQQEQLQFQVLDVLSFREKDKTYKTYLRSHSALSLRRKADTEIEYSGKTVHLKSHDLVFFPPDFGYIRRTKEDDMIVFHLNVIQGELPDELAILHLDRFDRLWPMFEEALEEWERGRPGYRFRVTAIVYRIFGEIQQRESRHENQNPEKMRFPLFHQTLHRPKRHICRNCSFRRNADFSLLLRLDN